MMTARIHLTRYRNGERRLSTAIHTQAEDIRGALATAESMLTGLRNGDASSEYDIVSVEMTGYGSGIPCDGSLWFETSSELTARLAVAKTSPTG